MLGIKKTRVETSDVNNSSQMSREEDSIVADTQSDMQRCVQKLQHPTHANSEA